MTYAMGAVRFDFVGSLSLARDLYAFADEVESARLDRRDAASTALQSWLGVYRDQFIVRRDREHASLGTYANALRAEADEWAKAWKMATDEQNVRNWAAARDQAKAERSNLEKGIDFFTGFSFPPPPPPVPVPVAPAYLPTEGGCY